MIYITSTLYHYLSIMDLLDEIITGLNEAPKDTTPIMYQYKPTTRLVFKDSPDYQYYLKLKQKYDSEKNLDQMIGAFDNMTVSEPPVNMDSLTDYMDQMDISD